MKYFFLLIPIVLASGCEQSEQGHSLPIVGLNSNGKSEVRFVDPDFLDQKLTPFLFSLSDSVSSTLASYDRTGSSLWELSRVTVGLKLETEFEVIEDFLELETEGDIELRFQKR